MAESGIELTPLKAGSCCGRLPATLAAQLHNALNASRNFIQGTP
jgi:hypothetical protein